MICTSPQSVVYWELDHSGYPLAWQIRLQINVIQMVPFLPYLMLRREKEKKKNNKKKNTLSLLTTPTTESYFLCQSDLTVQINISLKEHQILCTSFKTYVLTRIFGNYCPNKTPEFGRSVRDGWVLLTYPSLQTSIADRLGQVHLLHSMNDHCYI